MRIIQAATGFCLSCALGVAGAGDVYRWLDEQGRVHFGDRLPEGQMVTKLRLHPAPESQGAPEADRSQARERLLRYYDERRAEQREAAARTRQEQEAREVRCGEARRRLGHYEAAGRIFVTGEDGQRHFLSGEERDQLIARMRAEISRWCEG